MESLLYDRAAWLDASEARRDQLVLASVARSGKWPTLRAQWLREHPTCAACGQSDRLEVHHKKPFHHFPQLELAESNLLTLCEEGPGQCNCHLLVGHGGDWRRYNTRVVSDAKFLLRMLERVRATA